MAKAVTVIGIGDGGCTGLSSRAMNAVAEAQVLVGGKRQLEFFPQFRGEKIQLDGALRESLNRVNDLAHENNVCVLASGDPLFYGIAGLVIRKVGNEHVEVIPHPGAVQWAFAKIGEKWDDAGVISLHGRPRRGFLTRLKEHNKVALFTDETNSPPALAAYMLVYGETKWDCRLCENLEGPGERVRSFTVEELAKLEDVSPLNVLVLLRKDRNRQKPPVFLCRDEQEFARRMPKKGLITKKEVRILSLAALQIRRDSVVWDVGAGSGAVSLEAALLAREGEVHAVEVDPEGVEVCRENIQKHAVDNVVVHEGRAPEALKELPDPDGIFVGGTKGSMEDIIQLCLERLKPGGRLVVNAITMENVGEAYRSFRERDILPEVTLLNISRGVKLARYLRYEALNPIHIFAVTKEESK